MNNDKLLLNKFDNEFENNMLSTIRLMINLIKECKVNYAISFRPTKFFTIYLRIVRWHVIKPYKNKLELKIKYYILYLLEEKVILNFRVTWKLVAFTDRRDMDR